MAISERELEAARTARAVRTARADARAADLAPIIADLQVAGATTLQAIATELNRRGIPTATGRGEWSGKQVRRVLERLP
jgi:Recombinase